jgi:hypothetical protein
MVSVICFCQKSIYDVWRQGWKTKISEKQRPSAVKQPRNISEKTETLTGWQQQKQKVEIWKAGPVE